MRRLRRQGSAQVNLLRIVLPVQVGDSLVRLACEPTQHLAECISLAVLLGQTPLCFRDQFGRASLHVGLPPNRLHQLDRLVAWFVTGIYRSHESCLNRRAMPRARAKSDLERSSRKAQRLSFSYTH